jgi:hypothetical protein
MVSCHSDCSETRGYHLYSIDWLTLLFLIRENRVWVWIQRPDVLPENVYSSSHPNLGAVP